MLPERALVIAVAVAVVLWVALDSGWLRSEPALPGTSAALEALAALFAVSAWVMHKGGQPGRVPLLVGMALGTGAYGLIRAFAL